MGILGWIIFGLIVGVVAKFLMPGRDPEASSSRFFWVSWVRSWVASSVAPSAGTARTIPSDSSRPSWAPSCCSSAIG